MANESDKKIIIQFITEMYNNGKFHDYDFLYQHCTKKLIQQLTGDYEYEGDGLAVWDFRTEMQNGPTSKNHIIDVVYEGNDWYAYSF